MAAEAEMKTLSVEVHKAEGLKDVSGMLSDMSPYVHLQSMGQTFKTHEDSGGKTAPEWETAEVKSVFTFTLGDMDDDLLRDTKMFVTIKNGSTTVADAELALADLTRGGGSDRKWYTVRTDGEPKGNIMLSTKYRDPVAERAAAEARAKAEAEAKALAEQLEQAKRDREAAEQAATKAAADREAAAADRAAAEAALARLEAAQKAAEEAKAKEAEAQVSYDAKVEENEKAGYQFDTKAVVGMTKEGLVAAGDATKKAYAAAAPVVKDGLTKGIAGVKGFFGKKK